MRIALYVVGILLILNGAIWFFQGINFLPGSIMTGQIKWAVYGTNPLSKKALWTVSRSASRISGLADVM